MIVLQFIAVIIIGYLLGSIPSGVLVSKILAKVDVREYGSGKTGMTNVLRTAGKKAAALVFFLDLLKGALAVIFAGLIVGRNYLVIGGNFGLGLLVAQVLAALASIAGHNWSIFLGFKGGRGVLTFFGGLFALCPVAALFGGEVFIMIGTILIVIMHKENIIRLLSGKERRLGEKAKPVKSELSKKTIE
jgi:glycerol-3-phosphate acyltransferase PlsY